MSAEKKILQLGPGHAILADRVFDGHRWHAEAAVLIRDGRIAGVGPWNEVPAEWPHTRLPAGAFLAPGFIDLQVNGGGGVLLNDQPTADGMRAIARAHRRTGTTACLPTLITDTREQVRAAIAAARSAAGRDGILGLHLEGPFISPRRPGVHRPDRIAQPVAGDLEQLCELAGAGASLVTLAPECVPAGFVRTLASSGVRVSIGHSEASAAVVTQAVEDGATGVTHLFNAMPPLSGREPGIVGAALAERRLTAGLIVDGIHVDPVSIRTAFAAKGADRIALVTDAMPTVGSALDRFDLVRPDDHARQRTAHHGGGHARRRAPRHGVGRAQRSEARGTAAGAGVAGRFAHARALSRSGEGAGSFDPRRPRRSRRTRRRSHGRWDLD